MIGISDVEVGARRLDALAAAVGSDTVARTDAALRELSERIAGRVVWNVNSTARGGGVAEMLRPLLAYLRGAGCDVRWVTIGGDAQFFEFTKRLHHALHGQGAADVTFSAGDLEHYERVLTLNAEQLVGRVRPDDLVLLHDPQTAGLIGPLARIGCAVAWRCHIGADTPNARTERAWSVLRPFLEGARAFVFSLARYVPPFLGGKRCFVIPPSIDPLAPKNQPLAEDTVRDVLAHVGLLEGAGSGTQRSFRREDGSLGRVDRCADVLRLGRAPAVDARLIVQVSRWDALKDPIGVVRGFARLHENGLADDVHLVLAGPNVRAVADDPEGPAVFDAVVAAWRALPHGTRQRVHLANLPMADVEENACIVNALQRRATIVVQKSLAEGFGLTVTEAMAKARPVLGTRVGGIGEQIEHGVSGWLLDDPRDAGEFASSVRDLLSDPVRLERIGRAAREVACERYLCDRHFGQYAALLLQL